MSMFRKKPVVVEAFPAYELLDHAEHNWSELPECLRAEYEKGNVVFGANEIYITTLEGQMTAQKRDWVIRGVKGEFYPCKPEIFEATYERIS